MSIHPTAIVDPKATLGTGVTVGPYSVIGPGVEIGDRCWIGPHVVIQGPTRMGVENRIYQFASVGEIPQDKKYDGEPTRLEIGDRNLIRECATINRGTPGGGGVTTIGDDNWLMAYIHIAHDCHVGNHTIFSNNASLAGHVTVGDWAILSGFTMVHQFCAIGAHAFTGMGSSVAKDIPPYVMISGNPARPHGINREGLKRRGFTAEAIRQIKEAYRILYRSGLSLDDAKDRLREMARTSDEVRMLAEFVENSERSVIR